ncbi:MAG: [FeFe] hydrogenase H-cluster maturation GTPase HydF [Candidatus Omnitrophica bacterium]|nr:[FeFe] hydrogenase H-cluster maturation GTPase HydF [Candidatus Omnitrophota bacterium]
MKTTPKALRLHIGIFGRTNVGKSSFLNLVAGQDVAITSPVAGTTTDVVEKVMELLPIGPVVFLDTAGLDDLSALGELRIRKTKKVFDRSDVIILITEPDTWTDYEKAVMEETRRRAIAVIVAVNKVDIKEPSPYFIEALKKETEKILLCSSADPAMRDRYVNPLKKLLIEICPEDFLKPPPLVGDLVETAGLALFIIPIDKEAPKGRLILPQSQAIRDCLDHGVAVTVVRETEYVAALEKLKGYPDIVACDSQVVSRMVRETPPPVRCTTFSILFSRHRGDLLDAVRGVRAVDRLKPGDKVLLAEACSHHAIEDDIGRVKIPRWLGRRIGGAVSMDVCSGKDYPEDLRSYKLVIHCGGCMINRREMLTRIQKAREARVPMTNYGVCIAYLEGVLERVLSPFPAALGLLRQGEEAAVYHRGSEKAVVCDIIGGK